MKFWKSIIVIMPLTINSCSRNNPIDIDCENLNELESIYCINGNSSATIVWNAPIEFTQFSIYRDTLQDVKIISQNLKKTYQSIPRGYFKDENLENGKTYYYKILFEKNCDGQIKRILSELVTEAHPLNYNIDSSLITFQNHVKPILNSSCSVKGCHNSNDKIPFTSWNNLMEEDEGVSWIIPFKSSKSHLIYHINNDSLLTPISKPEMPSVEVKLPTEQIKLIMNWIDNGAKNENGVIPFTSISDDGVAIVTNQGEDLSAVIDLNLKRITRFVTTGVNDTKVNPPHAPHNVTIDNKNKFYYVNLISGNKLLKFQLSDHKKVGELSSGIISPSQAALNFSGDTAFVANFTSSQSAISVINTNSMSIIQNITDPRMIAPHGISITPNGKYVLSANQFSDNITIINSATLEVVDVIPLSAKLSLPPSATKIYEPYQSIITKDSKYAFITCANSNEVRVLDIEEKKIVDSISVGNRPLILDIAPNGENIYVANRNSNSVSIINVSQRKVTSTIQNVGQQPHGISVSSKGNLVIVSCENLLTSEQPHHPTSGGKNIGIVTLISTATNSIIKKIEVGNFAAGVATTK